MLSDIRYGFRSIRKSPGFAVVVILILALGIGANTSIFSVVNGVLLHPLDIPDRERVFVLFENRRQEANDRYQFSPANFFDVRDQNRTFDEMAAAIVFDGMGVSLSEAGEPERAPLAVVSPGFMRVLGYQPVRGRMFVEEDARADSRVVMIGQGLWKRRFAMDPSIVGKQLSVGGESTTIIGVLDASARYPENVDVWSPLRERPRDRTLRAVHYLTVVGRLKPDRTPQDARADLDGVAQRLAQAYPRDNTDTGITMIPIEEYLVGKVKPALLVLMAAVGLMLALACINVANLLLARASAERREYAIRAALGAGRWRLIRQAVARSLVLSMAGGIVGIGLGYLGTRLLREMATGQMPRLDTVTIDGRVLLFALAASVLTGITFGMMPALQAARQTMSDALKEGGRGSERHGVRLRGRLLVAEIALSLVLLAGAGLLIKSFLLLTSVPAGFRAENVLTLRLSLSGQQYNDDAKVSSFFSTLSERVRELPGVQAAGTVNAIPLTGSGATSWLTIEGRPHQGTPPEVMFRSADHGYFQALGIPLRSGRFFTSSDGPDAPKIVLVNEALARRFFPGEDPIGRRIRLGPNPNAAWRTIVGVTGDTRQLGPDRVPQPEAFESQMQDPMSTVTVAIRTAGDPMSLVGSVRAIVNSLDPNQPLFEVQTMEQVKSRSLAPQRLYMMLVGLFATLALILAAAGVYGLMAYSVEQRTLEIGLRMALGAQRSNVLRLMLGQSTRLVLVGIALGSVAALLVTRRLTTLLYEVRPNDPWTYVTAAAILATAALAASYVPTLRAIRIDPAVALRNE